MNERFAAARVARMGTVDEQGRAHLVPVVFVVDGDTIYSPIDYKPKSTKNPKRLHNIRRDPRVTLLVDHYEEVWPALWWIRVRGTARIIESGPEHTRAIASLTQKYSQYESNPLEEAIIAITPDDWREWQMTPA